MATSNLQLLVLTLTPHLETNHLPDGTTRLKQTTTATYLAIPTRLHPILAHFDGTRTVGEILQHILAQPHRPSIRDYWDLVLRARHLHILTEHHLAPPERTPRTLLPISIPPRLATITALITIFIGLGFLSSTSIPPPPTLLQLIITLAFASLTITLSHLAAAMVLRGCHRHAYSPRISARHLIPALIIDTDDAFMAGRHAHLSVTLLQIATPFFIGTIAYLTSYLPAQLAAILVIGLYTTPRIGTPAHTLIATLLHRQHTLRPYDLKDIRQHLIRDLITRPTADTYSITTTLYAAAWLATTLTLTTHYLQHHGTTLTHAILTPAHRSSQLAAILTILGITLIIIAPFAYQLWLIAANLISTTRHRFPIERHHLNAATPPTPELIQDITHRLSKTPIFADQPSHTLHQLAKHLTTITLPPHTQVLRQGDPSHALFIIHEGALDVYQHEIGAGRRSLRLLQPGDLFGEMALLDHSPRQATVTTQTRATLLIITPHTLAKAQAAASPQTTTPQPTPITDRLRLATFLKRVTIFADWPATSLIPLADHFQLHAYPAGHTFIHQDTQNHTFYLIYTGTVTITRHQKTIATLTESDFFGEISLLTDQPANATVTAATPTHCVTLTKTAFHAFLAQDFRTGYTLEDIAQRRTRQAHTS